MIAVYVNSEGNATSLSQKGYVRRYTCKDSEWEVKDEFEFSIDNQLGIIAARSNIANMVQQLGACKVFIASEVGGQLFYVLETNGFSIYEAEGQPKQFLNQIWEEEQTYLNSEKQREEPPKVIWIPQQTQREGAYFINLKKALLLDCSLTSKKILLPFLRNTKFDCLDVVCDHIPRWFDTEFTKLGLESTTTKINENEYNVCITTKLGRE